MNFKRSIIKALATNSLTIYKSNFVLTAIGILSLFLYSSCVTHKQLKYLDLESTEIDADSLYEIAFQDYYLQPGDLIDIKVKSMDPNSVAIFNNTNERNRVNVSESSVFLSSYHIDTFGMIDLPIAGKVHAEGLTLSQLNDSLITRLSGYFNIINVYSNLTSFRVTVMGEVNNPGSSTLFYDDNNVFNAIAHRGGFTDYANKTNLRLVRKSQGKQKVIKLNISKADFVTSPYFYLHPNDVIYVEPTRAKPLSLNIATFSLLISSLSLLFLIITTTTK